MKDCNIDTVTIIEALINCYFSVMSSIGNSFIAAYNQ
jgi:hypothetical protein